MQGNLLGRSRLRVAGPRLHTGLRRGATLPARIGDYTSSDPDRVRGPDCLLETLVCIRAAGTGREDARPDTNPSQLWAVRTGCLCVELRKEAESKKAPVEVGLGGEP